MFIPPSDFRASLASIPSLVIPTLLGTLFNYGLMGILIVQIFLYQSQFRKEQKIVNYFVYALLIAEILVAVLSTTVAWIVFSAGWGNIPPLTFLKPISSILPGLVGLVSGSAHVFFCWRISVLRSFSILAGFIMALSLTSWGTSITCGVFLGMGNFQWFKPFMIVWLATSFVCGVLITGTMVYVLYPNRSTFIFPKEPSLLRNLSRLLLETGMLVCILNLLAMTLFLFCPQNFGFLVPLSVLSILHSNTVLASLNSRPELPVAKNSLMLWDNQPPILEYRKPGKVDDKFEVYEDPFKSPPPRPMNQKAKKVFLEKRPLTAGFLTTQAFGCQNALNMDSHDDQHSFMTTYSAPFGAKRSTMWGQRSPTNGYLNSASQDAPDKDWRDDQSFFSISLYMDSQSPPSGRFAPNSARSSHFPPLPVRPGHTSARSSRFPPVFLAI